MGGVIKGTKPTTPHDAEKQKILDGILRGCEWRECIIEDKRILVRFHDNTELEISVASWDDDPIDYLRVQVRRIIQ